REAQGTRAGAQCRWLQSRNRQPAPAAPGAASRDRAAQVDAPTTATQQRTAGRARANSVGTGSCPATRAEASQRRYGTAKNPDGLPAAGPQNDPGDDGAPGYLRTARAARATVNQGAGRTAGSSETAAAARAEIEPERRRNPATARARAAIDPE